MALSSNNKFRQFGENALKLSDEQYDQVPNRKLGNVGGEVASASLNNTALSQTSIMATAIAEYIAKNNLSVTIDSNTPIERIVELLDSTIGSAGAGGDMKKSVFATLDPSGGYVDKAKNSDKLGEVEASEYVTNTKLNNKGFQTEPQVDARIEAKAVKAFSGQSDPASDLGKNGDVYVKY